MLTLVWQSPEHFENLNIAHTDVAPSRLFLINLPIASRKILKQFVRAAGGYLGGRLFGSAP